MVPLHAHNTTTVLVFVSLEESGAPDLDSAVLIIYAGINLSQSRRIVPLSSLRKVIFWSTRTTRDMRVIVCAPDDPETTWAKR